jgi:MFS family permease
MLADKIGKEKVLIIGYAVFAVSSLLMITLTGNSIYAYILAAVFGLYMCISETLKSNNKDTFHQSCVAPPKFDYC